MQIKDHVTGTSTFQYYRDQALWFKTDDTGFLFPVPLDDIGTTTIDGNYKSIKLMRWIRKHMITLQEVK